MSDSVPSPTVPPPATTADWALEIAAVCADLAEPRPLTLGDGSVLEAEDAREAVVLAAVAARGLSAAVDLADVEDLCAGLRDLEAAADETPAADDEALAVVTARYLAVHELMDLLADDPSPAWIASIEAAAAPLVGEPATAPDQAPADRPAPPRRGGGSRARRAGGGSGAGDRR